MFKFTIRWRTKVYRSCVLFLVGIIKKIFGIVNDEQQSQLVPVWSSDEIDAELNRIKAEFIRLVGEFVALARQMDIYYK